MVRLHRYTLSGAFRPAYSELSSEFGGWTGGVHLRFIKLCYGAYRIGGLLGVLGWGADVCRGRIFLGKLKLALLRHSVCPKKSCHGIRRSRPRRGRFWTAVGHLFLY